MTDIKQIILDEIAKTEKSIVQYKESTQPVKPDNSIGRLTRMEAIGSGSVSRVGLEQAQERLKALNHVLSNVDDEDFGICVSCRQPIAIERLLIVPESVYCIHCAR